MLANKWTFSLMSLVMLLAIGLLVVVPPATADHAHTKRFAATFSVKDVSSMGGNQVAVTTAAGAELTDLSASGAVLIVNVAFAKEVALTVPAGGDLVIASFVINTYDEDGVLLAPPTGGTANTILAPTAGFTGKNYILTINGDNVDPNTKTISVLIARDKVVNANRADVEAANNSDHKDLGKNERASITFDLIAPDPDPSIPTVYAIEMVSASTQSPFTAAGVRGTFGVRVVLSEKPKEFKVDHIAVTNSKVDSVIAGVAVMPDDEDGDETADTGTVGIAGNLYPDTYASTGRDGMIYPYLVTITPDLKKSDDVIISVKEFEDELLPVSMHYRPDPVDNLDGRVGGTLARNEVATDINSPLGNQKLVVKVDTTVVKADPDIFKPSKDGKLPHEVFLPEKVVIPADGYLVLARDAGKAGIKGSDAKLADKKDVGEDLYNINNLGFPYPGDDLQNYFRNGALIQLVYKDIAGNKEGANADTGYAGATSAVIAAGDVMINEIMWARAVLGDSGVNTQWIELHNTTAAPISLDKNEWVFVFGSTTSLTGGTVVDTAGNNPAASYWKALGGSNVETFGDDDANDIEEFVSMSRMAGTADGTAAASWAVSILPSANVLAGKDLIATPGAPNNYMMVTAPVVEEPVVEEPVVEEPTATVATAADIMISEIMVASNDGRLPQWIELVSTSAMDLSLAGWSVVIDNSDDDADVHGAGAQIQVDIGDVMVGAGETVLLVSKEGRNSGVDEPGVMRTKGDANAGNLDADRIVDLSDTLMPSNVRYTVLSEMGFTITLMPPQTGAIRMSGDTVGNLGEGWDIPMAESGRSSIVRREMGVDMMAIMGTAEKGWVLASGTALVGAYVSTYYGSDEDVGTPGYDAGGPLPVELSMFYPARDKVTGQVVITWETQSELNNAGFFIKRSEQSDGKFLVINPTMIPGAGTTSEKKSYTYTDTTAKPNVLYYYQIEDVSLDGQHRTLTHGHRLRGHIGAAGKATTTWGELKAQE